MTNEENSPTVRGNAREDGERDRLGNQRESDDKAGEDLSLELTGIAQSGENGVRLLLGVLVCAVDGRSTEGSHEGVLAWGRVGPRRHGTLP
ncbi:hypothetical protein AU506_16845 [Lonsdalea populi]|nr:hypothetical protein AU506_16845 [Lonsdalea populi]